MKSLKVNEKINIHKVHVSTRIVKSICIALPIALYSNRTTQLSIALEDINVNAYKT